MNIPNKATHYLSGDFYHERGDGQYMKYSAFTWSNAVDVNSNERMERALWPLSDDLTWLALRCDNWAGRGHRKITRTMAEISPAEFMFIPADNPEDRSYTYNQWLTRRRELGLEDDLPVTPQEDEAWDEKRMDTIGANGNDGDHYDSVNHPEHYTQGGIECIDAIEAALTPEEFRGYCKGNALKYIWRERMKGGEESIAKAEWYLDKV